MTLLFSASLAHVSLSVGVTAGQIAWPIVLVLCGALMILPFVFLVLVFRPDDDEPSVVSSEVSTPAAGRGK